MSSTGKRCVYLQGYHCRPLHLIILHLAVLKCDTFSRSSDAVFELSLRFVEPFKRGPDVSEQEHLEAERLMFLELTQGTAFLFPASHIRLIIATVCLWGNSTDLSLLINMSEEQIKSLQSTGGEHLAATEKNILGNHMGELWSTVKDLRVKTGGRIDFVLDNAGFELYCDMVYGTFT